VAWDRHDHIDRHDDPRQPLICPSGKSAFTES
jgi:hypothetical protein